MVSKKIKLLLSLSLFCAAVMLLFSFLNLGFFTDEGWVVEWDVPIGTKKGTLSTLSDTLFLLIPLFLALSTSPFFFRPGKGIRFLSALLCGAPLCIYFLFEIIPILDQGSNLHFSVLITLFFFLFEGCLILVGANNRDITRLAAYASLLHLIVEIALLIASFLFREKYSQFCFYQLLPFGRTSVFSYGYFLLSVCINHLSCILSLFFRSLALTVPVNTPSDTETSSSPKAKEEEIEEEPEEESVPLSLEDFGIER